MIGRFCKRCGVGFSVHWYEAAGAYCSNCAEQLAKHGDSSIIGIKEVDDTGLFRYTVSIGEDFVCPNCEVVTSSYATKLQCDCYKKFGYRVNLGGIFHL